MAAKPSPAEIHDVSSSYQGRLELSSAAIAAVRQTPRVDKRIPLVPVFRRQCFGTCRGSLRQKVTVR